MARPSSYDPKFAEQAAKLCQLGATDKDVADFLEIDVATLYRWRHTYPEFCEALKVGKSTADERVVHSLYHKAIGYSYEAVKIMAVEGTIHKVDYVEHVPPDTTAAIFWLKNRRPAEWRDRREFTGPDGGPIPVQHTADTELAREIAFLLRKATAGAPQA